jgi:hypothetical protein
MKVTYFAYCLKEKSTENRCLIDLRKFLRAYCSFDSPGVKNSFVYNGENVYLIHYVDDIFFFIMTRNGDIIRKINSVDFSVGDIGSLLNDHERIGFASYVLIKDKTIGFASTIFAPKVDVFSSFMNHLFTITGNDQFEFCLRALMHQSTRSDVYSFPYVGRTILEVDRSHSGFEGLLAQLGGKDADVSDLGSLEIHIKPKPKKNINEVAKNMATNIGDDGLLKFMMRAQAAVGSQTMDMYLVGQGAVTDYISQREDPKIAEALQRKSNSNPVLKAKLDEYLEEEVFDELGVGGILDFNVPSAWAAIDFDV